MRQKPLYCLLLTLLLSSVALAAYRTPACSREGMAATPHTLATEAAVDILRKGGNAVDAAIAAAFVLSVVEQYHSGLGGGEFALVLPKSGSAIAALDAREYAPAGLRADMFIDTLTGEPHPTRSWKGGLAVGVPGSVAGRSELHKKYGRLPWKEILLPSIRIAKEGFLIDRILAARLTSLRDDFGESPALTSLFFAEGKPLERGSLLKQPVLAGTLEQIASDRGKSFYSGSHAKAIVAEVKRTGGILSEQDLADHRFVWREPVHFEYRGFDVYSMPPPSSGGLCLALIFNILEPLPIKYLGNGSSETIHLVSSAYEHAFADRARWLADPDYAPQPKEGMLSEIYANQIRAQIKRDGRTPVTTHGDPWTEKSGNTSHISVIDKEGGMCAITTSVNGAFGSLVFVPELGIFLNNTMDDFTISTTTANIFDLTQGEVNLVEPGKRPLSSMSPTLLLKDGQPYASIGSVGGPRIITSIALMLINLVDYGMDIQSAMDAPRFHMQWSPDLLYLEEEFSPATVSELIQKGWNVNRGGRWSISQGVTMDWKNGLFYGGADARGVGSAGPNTIP